MQNELVIGRITRITDSFYLAEDSSGKTYELPITSDSENETVNPLTTEVIIVKSPCNDDISDVIGSNGKSWRINYKNENRVHDREYLIGTVTYVTDDFFDVTTRNGTIEYPQNKLTDRTLQRGASIIVKKAENGLERLFDRLGTELYAPLLEKV